MKKAILILAMALVIPITTFAWTPSDSRGIPAGGEWQYENPTVVKCEYTKGWVSTKFVWCYDLTNTNWYKNQMIGLAKQLLANGFWTQFPQYQQWYYIVRGY